MRAYEDAINAWENALKYGMNRRIAMTRIGDSYMNINDLENAEISYQNIVAIGYDKYAYLGMYRIHLKRNHIDKAFETLTMLMKKEPHDPRISSEYNTFVEKYPHVKNIENKKAVASDEELIKKITGEDIIRFKGFLKNITYYNKRFLIPKS